MSRVGRAPVPIPEGVDVTTEGVTVHVRGPKGELQWDHPEKINVIVMADEVRVSRTSDQRMQRAQHGLTRSLISNMVEGVSEGFTKTLEIQGTGYRAELDGKALVLRVGYSHTVRVEPHPGIMFNVDGNNMVTVAGIDKQAVGQQAAEIRRVRPPEPYKGKGIRYRGEWVRRKTGKGAIGMGVT